MIIDTTQNARSSQRKPLDYDMLRICKLSPETNTMLKYPANLSAGFQGSWHITLMKGTFYEERYPFSNEAEARRIALNLAKKI